MWPRARSVGHKDCLPSYQGCQQEKEKRWFWSFFLNLHPRRSHPSVSRATCQSRKTCVYQVEILVPVYMYVM